MSKHTPNPAPSKDQAIELLEEIQKLMELKGENPFKVRAFERAAQALARHDDLAARARMGTLTEIPGIGKGISDVLAEFFLSGKSSVKEELEKSIPAGLLELTGIPGLGPKKAMHLIEELGITSVAELEYACRENRLLKLKGFGEKIQSKILEAIEFRKTTAGKMRLSDAFPFAERALAALLEAAGGRGVSEAGEIRRRCEIVSGLDFLVSSEGESAFERRIAKRAQDLSLEGLEVRVHFARPERFGYELARLTGTREHWEALGSPRAFDAPTEEAFFEKLGLAFIPPEMRETGEEVALARGKRLGELLPWDGVQGVFHNHTTRSDGAATLDEMVEEARRLGFRYIGISDHSKTAFYAQGLTEENLREQEREVRKAQERHPDIRIFWGIESDILADGSLDYDDSTLARFDFVIASIHSRFQMDRETMTQRILEAVRHPRTRFLGHATGRILLGRKGYDVDMEKIIAECAKRDVAIEINANPARLDIDWRWGPELRRRGTKVSVNPDAHDTSGLSDTRFGIAMARKALLPSAAVVNSGSVKEVERWLRRA